MTVIDLKEILNQFPDNAEVKSVHETSFMYDPVTDTTNGFVIPLTKNGVMVIGADSKYISTEYRFARYCVIG